MPRQARVIVKDHPHHIVQRGHNRESVFFDDEDYLYYIENLRSLKYEHNVKVFAFCLFDNHVHLILDPGSQPDAIALMMKRLAGRQTRFINRKYGKTGTIWEGRYKSSPIETKRYLVACCRYIELHPDRMEGCDGFELYKWSSYQERFLNRYRWLDICECFDEFGDTADEKQRNYHHYLLSPIDKEEWNLIRAAIARESATGNSEFILSIAKVYGLPVANRKRGRPKKILAYS
ncbi:MAG: transposase [Gammaproteobacteria bacterium]|nr:transposase [Gammaproteobacteria bacterium]